MALKNDLESIVKKIFAESWSERNGQVVPEPESLGLGNDARNIMSTILSADINGSTNLVDNYSAKFAAEVYKTYLACAARIIKDQEGTITSYDGDRVMAVFIGGSKNTNAVRTALKINSAVDNIIQPAMYAQYPETTFSLKHVVGVDTSKLFVSRIGVRNDNDLVWVGRAANYAAKLSEMSTGHPIYITGNVYDAMNAAVKYGGPNKINMWEERSWTSMNNLRIFRSNWRLGV
jgi:class 3 adenylate cyclase